MTAVRARWLSKRAVSLHAAVLVLVPGCAVAAWWQVNRAEDGNMLSYLYSVMWPVFGLLAIYFWWLLLHVDYEKVGLKGMRRAQTEAQAPTAADTTSPAAPTALPAEQEPVLATGGDDPELAAYTARLAALSAKGAKTWRNRETVVVRRAQ